MLARLRNSITSGYRSIRNTIRNRFTNGISRIGKTIARRTIKHRHRPNSILNPLNENQHESENIFNEKEKIKKEIYDLIQTNANERMIKSQIYHYHSIGYNSDKPLLKDLLINNALYVVIMLHGGIKDTQHIVVPKGMDIFRVSPTKIGVCTYSFKQDVYDTMNVLRKSLNKNKNIRNTIKDVIPTFDTCRQKLQTLVSKNKDMNQEAIDFCKTHTSEIQHRKEGKKIINKVFQIIFNDKHDANFNGIFIVSKRGVFDLLDYIPKTLISIEHKKEFYVLTVTAKSIIDTVHHYIRQCSLVMFDLSCSSRPDNVSPNTFKRQMREIESKSHNSYSTSQ